MSTNISNRRLLASILVVVAAFAAAKTLAQDAASNLPPAKTNEPAHWVTVELFVRPDSERSEEASAALREFKEQRRGVRLQIQDVVNDQIARERFWKLAKTYRIEKPVVPAFYALNRFQVGFRDPKSACEKLDEFLNMDTFVREGCPHCRDAKAFLVGMQQRWPGIKVRLFDVVQDGAAANRMYELAKQHNVTVVSLPCFSFCGRVMVGYQDDQTTGRQLERVLEESQPPSKMAGAKTSMLRGVDGRQNAFVRAAPAHARIVLVSYSPLLAICILPGCTARSDSAAPSTASKDDQRVVVTDPPPTSVLSWQPVFRDIEDRVHEPFQSSKVLAIALVFVLPDCPIANSYIPALNRLREEFMPRGIEVFIVHADPQLTANAARQHAREYNVTSPVLLDAQHAWVTKAGITRTPEAAVFSSSGELLYRGRIDDQYVDLGKRRTQVTSHDLTDALKAILAGRPIPNPRTEAVGCFIPKLHSGGSSP